ncbi:MAG: right-handed parallel beta-helix repeat-containing protein [Tannerellaceae bacterium]|nr:right-handed parallel beta-helix repeat-containing protein [Tannerellaceae bacterium]
MKTRFFAFPLWLGVMLYVLTACSGPVIYYLDAVGGDDRQTGLSEQKAWKSLDKIKEVTLRPGDRILLKRGTTFTGELYIQAKGTPEAPIIIDAYGVGDKPCIKGLDQSMQALWIYNSEYIQVNNLEIVNTGKERLRGRTGIKVEVKDYGVSRSITLNGLDVRDVNGSLVKEQGGGSGMLFVNGGDSVISVFDGLLVENCTIRRCERNAMIWGGYANRANWHPNTNVVIRNNLIEEVPGDGIVPIGCYGALIEYNRMRNCPATLPDTEAAAGIWPWSCDNTLIQFNEVSDHKAPWDAQGFDSDWNCTNTVIQYNYSHDNEGGFVLICNDGGSTLPFSIGNKGTIVRYNISINDATRTCPTRDGMFSPTIHFAGPVKNTYVSNNILHSNKKLTKETDRTMISITSWGGFADSTQIKDNLFYSAEPSRISVEESTRYAFTDNFYLGTFTGKEVDSNPQNNSATYSQLIEKDPSGFHSLNFLLTTRSMDDFSVTYVNKEEIEKFFHKIAGE